MVVATMVAMVVAPAVPVDRTSTPSPHGVPACYVELAAA